MPPLISHYSLPVKHSLGCGILPSTFAIVEKIITRTAEFWIDTNEVLHSIILPNVTIDFEDALDNSLVVRNLTQGKKVLKLTDSRNAWSIESKAKELVKRENENKTLARAVLVTNAVDSSLRNFFTKLNAAEVPLRFFTDYDQAYAWLLSQKGS